MILKDDILLLSMFLSSRILFWVVYRFPVFYLIPDFYADFPAFYAELSRY